MFVREGERGGEGGGGGGRYRAKVNNRRGWGEGGGVGGKARKGERHKYGTGVEEGRMVVFGRGGKVGDWVGGGGGKAAGVRWVCVSCGDGRR